MRRAVAQPKRDGTMNKTEQAYAHHLDWLKSEGEVLEYRFESVTLRLAKRTRYTPDFMLIMDDGTIELHEVKGFWRDDARVKIKVAAEMYPMFRFVAVKKIAKKHGGGWSAEGF